MMKCWKINLRMSSAAAVCCFVAVLAACSCAPSKKALRAERIARAKVGIMSVVMDSAVTDPKAGLPENFDEKRYVAKMAGMLSMLEPVDPASKTDYVSLVSDTYLRMEKETGFRNLPSALSPAISGKANGPCHYFLFVPEAYRDPKVNEQGWPLFIMLHGAGGNIKCVLQGLADMAGTYGYILVCPTYGTKGAWWEPGAREFLNRVIQDVSGKYEIDRTAVILAGASNGAAGAWAISEAEPGRFSAVVSISGPFSGKKGVKPGKGPPVFIVHGAADRVIPAQLSQNAYTALAEIRPGTVFREYPDSGHLVFFKKNKEILEAVFAWIGNRKK